MSDPVPPPPPPSYDDVVKADSSGGYPNSANQPPYPPVQPPYPPCQPQYPPSQQAYPPPNFQPSIQGFAPAPAAVPFPPQSQYPPIGYAQPVSSTYGQPLQPFGQPVPLSGGQAQITYNNVILASSTPHTAGYATTPLAYGTTTDVANSYQIRQRKIFIVIVCFIICVVFIIIFFYSF